MGLIKKKTASRGSDGGVKYVCDVCSSDITSTVSSVPERPPPSIPRAQATLASGLKSY